MCTQSDTAAQSLSGRGRKEFLQNIQEIPASSIHSRGWLSSVVSPLADSPFLVYTYQIHKDSLQGKGEGEKFCYPQFKVILIPTDTQLFQHIMVSSLHDFLLEGQFPFLKEFSRRCCKIIIARSCGRRPGAVHSDKSTQHV